LGRFTIGNWTVSPEMNCLERAGQTHRLEPKIMQVLLALADSPGDVVSKEQIFHRVWPDTFVSDEVLTRSISELRKAFEDNPRESTYIQTIPKAGYRLVAPVTLPAEAKAEAKLTSQLGRHGQLDSRPRSPYWWSGLSFTFTFGRTNDAKLLIPKSPPWLYCRWPICREMPGRITLPMA